MALVAISIFYWKKSQIENDAHRSRILARQRAIQAELGPIYTPLRDHVERWTLQTAHASDEDDAVVSTELQHKGGVASLLAHPGVYLRLLQTEATDSEGIRKAAQESLKDAFVACFFPRRATGDPHEGKACQVSKECERGAICNEVGHCTKPSQPYNLRVAYRGMRVLAEPWVRDVETATDSLRLQLYESDLDEATANDVPEAIDLLKQAQFFLVVIDTVPEGLIPAEGNSLAETVQATVHPVRVALYNLTTEQLLFRVTRTVDVAVPVVPGAVDAQRRQVLNCALAQQVREAIHF